MNNLNLHSIIISRDKNYSLEKATDIQIHLCNPCSLLWTTSMRWLVTEVGHMNSHERKETDAEDAKSPTRPGQGGSVTTLCKTRFLSPDLAGFNSAVESCDGHMWEVCMNGFPGKITYSNRSPLEGLV